MRRHKALSSATLLLQNGSSKIMKQVRALPKIIKVLKLFYKYPAIANISWPQWPDRCKCLSACSTEKTAPVKKSLLVIGYVIYPHSKRLKALNLPVICQVKYLKKPACQTTKIITGPNILPIGGAELCIKKVAIKCRVQLL
jgi:hypothetical protein